MYFYFSKNSNVFYNLALEDYLLEIKSKEINDNIIMLWETKNCIVIGRNQNIFAEINIKETAKNHVDVARRKSGGGAVYQDHGNINFSFITNIKGKKDLVANYKAFCQPIIDFLKTLKIEAHLSGRNDILIGERKISGNAQRISDDFLLHHGTLLYDIDIEKIVRYLNPDIQKLISKGIQSVKSRVANIKEYTNNISTEEFSSLLNEYFTKNSKLIILNDKDLKAISQREKEFKSKEWIHGKQPDFNFENKKRFAGGSISVQMKVENNKIQDIKFSGDFLSLLEVDRIEKKIIGSSTLEVKKILNGIENFSDYFGSITKEEIFELISVI